MQRTRSILVGKKRKDKPTSILNEQVKDDQDQDYVKWSRAWEELTGESLDTKTDKKETVGKEKPKPESATRVSVSTKSKKQKVDEDKKAKTKKNEEEGGEKDLTPSLAHQKIRNEIQTMAKNVKEGWPHEMVMQSFDIKLRCILEDLYIARGVPPS